MADEPAAKLLIIEDDPYVRRFYSRLFQFQQYEVHMAENGKEGVEQAKILNPALILLDIVMPVMDGLTALKHLKADPKTKDIPVLMLTNVGEEKTIKEAFENGAVGFLIKADFSPDDIVNQVNQRIK